MEQSGNLVWFSNVINPDVFLKKEEKRASEEKTRGSAKRAKRRKREEKRELRRYAFHLVQAELCQYPVALQT